MDVSIIIPVLNEAAGIVEAVSRARDTNAHEVIVVDGGSTDRTFELARKSGARTLQSSLGRAVQMNTGAREASGEVLLFLHADCWVGEDALQQITKAVSENSVRCGAFRQKVDSQRAIYRMLEFGNALRVRFRQLPYGDQGLFFMRGYFEELGGFPEVRLMEDLLLMKSARRGNRVALLPGPIHVSARRWERHGVVRQTIRNYGLLTAHAVGVSPNRLADFYQPHWK